MRLLPSSFRARLVILFLLLSLVPLVAVSAVAYYSARGSLTREAKAHMESVASLKKASVGDELEHVRRGAEMLAADPDVQRNAAAVLTLDPIDPRYADVQENLTKDLLAAVDGGGLDTVVVHHPQSGEVVAATAPEMVGASPLDEACFTEGKKGTSMWFTPYSRFMGGPTAFASTPLRDSSGRLLGVLVGFMDWDKLNPIMLERSGLGETGETYLVGQNKLMLTESRFDPQAAAGRRVDTEGVERALRGESGVAVYPNYRGVPVIGAFRYLDELGVALLAEVSEAEALAPANTLRRIIIVAVGVSAGAVVAVSLFLTAQVTRPLSRLADYARRVAAGDYAAQAPSGGADEFADVSRDIRSMVGQLLSAQEQLRQSRQRYEELVASVDGIVWEADAQTLRFSFVSRQAERLLGYPVERWLSEETFWTDHIHEDDRERCVALRAEATAQKRDHESEYRMLAADGWVVWLRDIVTVVVENERPAKLRGLMVDITEHKQMEERLLASERLATLAQVSSSISHELRNPLGVIDSSAYYLKTRWEGADEKIVEHLDRIRATVGSATATIEGLRALTRMGEPQLERLDLLGLVSDTIAATEVPAAVSVVEDFPPQGLEVNGDREQLRLVFKNIIDNAVQAMDGEGTLTVSARRTASGQVELSFADSGPGIAPEDLERVFQPLFTTKARGFGLGLAIARTVIDGHGGAIEARSEPGGGATFVIRLPSLEGGRPTLIARER